MKTLKIYFFFVVSAMIFVQPLQAVTYVVTPNQDQTGLTKKSANVHEASKALKQQFKQEKRMAKFERMVAKMGIDMKDPVQKWLWFAILCWGVSVILYILSAISGGFLWYLAYLASVAGAIFFVIWLLKMLEVA